MDDHEVKLQLDRMEIAINETKAMVARTGRAVFGELDSGLTGLVHDVRELKEFKEKQNIQAAKVSGAVAMALLGLQYAWKKIFP
jgi:hypothetical protein